MSKHRRGEDSRLASGIIGVTLLLVAFGALRFGLLTPLGRMLLNHSMEVRDELGKRKVRESPKPTKQTKSGDTD